MFTPGTRFAPPDDHVTGPHVVERVIDAGPLLLPTGRIVACDPGRTDSGEPFTVVVPPGSNRTEIATAAYPTEHWGKALRMEDFTGARVVVSDKPTVAWEMALRPGEDPRTLREGEFHGFGVDTGARSPGATSSTTAAWETAPMPPWSISMSGLGFGGPFTCPELWLPPRRKWS